MTDLRTTLARPDLAPAGCEGLMRAAVFAKPRRKRVIAPAASLRSAPNADAEQVSQLLFGEGFDVLREDGAFSWGQARRDGYVGWVESRALGAEGDEPTHWVQAPRTTVLMAPKIRAPSIAALGMGALCRVAKADGAFSEVEGLGWVATAHLAPIGLGFRPAAQRATAFLGVPYVWGARDGAGLDCSGLVQQCLHGAGLACSRDADQQAAIGVEVARSQLKAGDLVAWRGHIGMMLDGERLIHANAHHMAVAVEPLTEAIERIEAAGVGAPTAYRRPGLSPALVGSLTSVPLSAKRPSASCL